MILLYLVLFLILFALILCVATLASKAWCKIKKEDASTDMEIRKGEAWLEKEIKKIKEDK